MGHSYHLPDLVIANGQTESNVLTKADFHGAAQFVIGAPATLTGTVTISISLDDGVSYQTLQSDGTDIELAAAKATAILVEGWDRMKLASSLSEVAERTFKVKAIEPPV